MPLTPRASAHPEHDPGDMLVGMDTGNHDRPVALVTGASRGIGQQIARELADRGFTVLVGSRNEVAGTAAAAAIGEHAHCIQLDVTDPTSVAAAARLVASKFGRLDVLVNNAGVAHTGEAGRPLREIAQAGRLTVASIAGIRAVFETNVFGVVALTQAMLPLLRNAPAGRIVNIGSSGGSLTLNSDPANAHRGMFGTYSASKAALHAVTLAFALALEATDIKVNIACPGFTATALNGFAGTRSVEEGAREAVRLATLSPDGPNGSFSDESGPVPW